MTDPVREVVVGSGVAGLSAAASAPRADLDEPDATAERATGPTPTPTA